MGELRLTTISQALQADDWLSQEVALQAIRRMTIPRGLMLEWLHSNSQVMQRAGIAAGIHGGVVLDELLATTQKIISDDNFVTIRDDLAEVFRRQVHLPEDLLKELANSGQREMQFLAMCALDKPEYADSELTESGLYGASADVAMAAARAYQWKHLSIQQIKDMLMAPDPYLRLAAILSAKQRNELPFKYVALAMLDDMPYIREAAARVCAWRRIPNECLNDWMQNPETPEEMLAVLWHFEQRDQANPVWRSTGSARRWIRFLRRAANCCSAQVRKEAVRLMGLDYCPMIRDFEPTGNVFKKCVGDVVVIAKVLDGARIRSFDGGTTGRASDVAIWDVTNDFFGERVGISRSDLTTMYRPGDVVHVADFDISDDEDSTEFYFATDFTYARRVM